MSSDIYLDGASATPLIPAAREAMIAALDEFGDPLWIHARGRAARSVIEDARATVAASLGAQPDEIVFTSGGTESVALAVWGAVRAMRELGNRIVVSAVEHPAVGGVGNALQSDGFEVVEVPRQPGRRVAPAAGAAQRPAAPLAGTGRSAAPGSAAPRTCGIPFTPRGLPRGAFPAPMRPAAEAPAGGAAARRV